MFTKYNLFITVTLIYLPMCVTRSGIVLGKRQEDVFSQIRKIKGYKMILNLPAPVPGFACGLTCPKCILDLKWKTPAEYLAAMRSGYRYRIKKALKASASLTLRVIDNKTEFSDELYAMYLAVLHASKIRIETLSKEYFMGDAFKIFVMENQGHAVGFVQLLENGSELIFEFVGIDYSCHERFDTYERMLYEIVCWGITHGFKTVDFGQTADDAKLKLGSHYVPLYACLHHSHPLILAVCRLLAKKIEYKPLTTPFRVFSDRGRAETENSEREKPR